MLFPFLVTPSIFSSSHGKLFDLQQRLTQPQGRLFLQLPPRHLVHDPLSHGTRSRRCGSRRHADDKGLTCIRQRVSRMGDEKCAQATRCAVHAEDVSFQYLGPTITVTVAGGA